MTTAERNKLNEFIEYAKKLGCEIEGSRLPISVFVKNHIFCLGNIADRMDDKATFALIFQSHTTGIIRICVNTVLSKCRVSKDGDLFYYSLTNKNKGTVPFEQVSLDALKTKLKTALKRIDMADLNAQKEAICTTDSTLRNLIQA